MRSSRIVTQSLVAAGVGLSFCAGTLAQEAKADACKELPAASSLFQKCFAALGSEETLNSIQSGECTIEAPEMMGASSASMQALAPDKCRVDVELMEGEAFVVVNGEHMWSQGPGEGLEYGENEEVAMILVMMAPQFYLHSAPARFDMKTTGTTKVDGDECYTVELSRDDEPTGTAVLFNAESGLCAGFSVIGPTGLPVNYVVTEWGEVDGMKVITEAALDMTDAGMGELVFGFKDFKFNKVDAKVFEMPEEVKEMMSGDGDDGDDGDDKADGGDGLQS